MRGAALCTAASCLGSLLRARRSSTSALSAEGLFAEDALLALYNVLLRYLVQPAYEGRREHWDTLRLILAAASADLLHERRVGLLRETRVVTCTPHCSFVGLLVSCAAEHLRERCAVFVRSRGPQRGVLTLLHCRSCARVLKQSNASDARGVHRRSIAASHTRLLLRCAMKLLRQLVLRGCMARVDGRAAVLKNFACRLRLRLRLWVTKGHRSTVERKVNCLKLRREAVERFVAFIVLYCP